ncbi:MAG: transketolase [Acidimicrobiia bacterium]|nr:transketolase [Acidimicrobiia bacterium]
MNDHLESLAVATIKGLSMDGVQKANSGHPGMPMGMADIAVVLWSKFLTVDPRHPQWPDRDRFVLSNGHGSMLLYSLLHLSGFPITMDDLKNFRQWGSHTDGHPEIHQELGIEMTTGPLGQGFGTGVGMAIAEAHLQARLGSSLVNHRTFGFVSDGDLMEGISAESASLAGHFGLGKLVYFYDDNDISIDGSTDIAFSENVQQRFEAVGWQVLDVDGHERQAIAEATEAAIADLERPSLVICRTIIAQGSPNKANTAGSHGSPLGDDEIRLTKAAIGLPPDEQFFVPDGVYEFFSDGMQRGREAHDAWMRRRDDALADPAIADTWNAFYGSDPVTFDEPGFEVGSSMATRASSGKLFSQIAEKAQNFIGGAADLVGSTKTVVDSGRLFSKDDRAARDIAFGIREHAMGTIVNGMAVHGGLRPYGATFFVFSDYMRPAVRLSALMGVPSVWVWTHDSIFLGEDGPTHQPVEHLASLRAMPNLRVIRPADANEVVAAWEMALNHSEGPTALVLSRQNVPTLASTGAGAKRGGYVVRDGADAILVATGSEVHVAIAAAEELEATGVAVRVVSLPCWEVFFEQDEEYRSGVLGDGPIASLEAASTFGWQAITGSDGLNLGLDRFGASAPDDVLAEQFGFTSTAVAAKIAAWLA